MNNIVYMIHNLLVYKSQNDPNPHFLIYEWVDSAQDYIFKARIPIGQVVSGVLNLIITYRQCFKIENVEEYDDLRLQKINIFELISSENFNHLIDHINELVSLCEEAKCNGRNRAMNFMDWKKYYPYYYRLKDLAYFLTENTENFSSCIEKYLADDDDLLYRDYKCIIHEFPKKEIIEEFEYKIYSVKDYEALFALDLEELLFGNSKFPKYCTCSGCGKSFISNHRNCQYCDNCNTPERNKNRKKEWRQDKINKRSEDLNNIYSQRIVRAVNHISTDYDSEETVNRLKAEKKAFMNKLDYYKKVVKNQIHPDETDTNYDPSIKTEDDLINWLDEVRAYLNNTKLDNHCNLIQTNTDVKEKYHAKDDEKEERDGIDYESER